MAVSAGSEPGALAAQPLPARRGAGRERVGPFRALFTAHLQAGFNRSAKEMGKGGFVAFLLLAFLAGCLVLLPGLGAATALGYVAGQALANPVTVPLLALAFLAAPLGAGLVGGLSGGTQALTWESYQTFPLRFRTLFLAELAAGLGDLLPLMLGLASACFLAGLGLAAPRTLLLAPLIWGVGTLVQLSVQHLVGGLAAALVKRLRVGLVVLAVAAWMATVLLPKMALNPEPRASRAQRRAQVHAQVQAQAASLGRAGEQLVSLGRWAAWVPQGQMALGVVDAAEGRWVRGLARQSAGLGFALLLLWGAARMLRWERQPEAVTADTRGAARPLWTFRGPVTGLARLSWETILGSHLGRFGFLMPLFTLVLIKGPLGQVGHASPWMIPGAFTYLSLTGSQLLYNQFGLYGHGVKALLLLPVRARDLLLGQILGLGAYLALQGLLTALLLKLLTPAAPLDLLAGLALGACFFFTQACVGHFTSAAMPRTMPRDSLKSGGMPVLLVLINLGTTFGAGLLFGGAYALVAWLAHAWLLPAMVGLAVLCAAVYALLLPVAAAYFQERRDKVVEALG